MPTTPDGAVRRVAVLGGTFDPVHLGHLALLARAREAIGAGEGWLLPAGRPALRDHPVAAAELRLAMLDAAISDVPGARVIDAELRRPGTSYTVDTLAALDARDPGREHWGVLGADAARRIGEWHRSDELLRTARLVIAQREEVARFDASEARTLGFDDSRTVVLADAPPAVSASDIRRRVAAGLPLDGLVPRAVAEIIAASGLYAGGAVP